MTTCSYFKNLLCSGMLMILFLVFFSCQENHSEEAKKEFQKKQAIAYSKKLKVPAGNEIKLTSAAEEKIAGWQEFLVAKTEVENIPEFTVQDALQNAKNIQEAMKALEVTLPEELKTKPVLARIGVLQSLSGMLVQFSPESGAKAEDIEKIAEEIPVAFQNLKIQINEAYRKGLEDFRVESEKDIDPALAPVLKRSPIILKSKK